MSGHLAKSLVGACGVFCVSAELSRRGWIAMPTIRNTTGVDIIASKAGKAVKIQVKTNSYGKIKYPLTEANETLFSNDLFYVFVTLKMPKERPDFFIVILNLLRNISRKLTSIG
jgi:Holliday junction resolvase